MISENMKVSKAYTFKESEFGGFLATSDEFRTTFDVIGVTLDFSKSLEDGHWTCTVAGSDHEPVDIACDMLEEMDIKAKRARKARVREAVSAHFEAITAASNSLLRRYTDGIATQFKREDETSNKEKGKVRSLFIQRPKQDKDKTEKVEKKKRSTSHLYYSISR